MSHTIVFNESHTSLFDSFARTARLTLDQQKQFEIYLKLLLEWNELFNLTAVTDIQKVLADHFLDSLAIRDFVDFSSKIGLVDVGSGGGFPGIPLKICFPDLFVLLIEVNQKKIHFLETVIATLGLSNIEIYGSDWRTFLRKTSYSVDIFCSRASLAPEELIRMFQPSCYYNSAQLVYWASQHWVLGTKEASFFEKEVSYKVEKKQRRLIFFKKMG